MPDRLLETALEVGLILAFAAASQLYGALGWACPGIIRR